MPKLLNFLLLLSFQFGYLEWGKNNHAFIFETTAEIFRQSAKTLQNFLHPAILIPLVGEILILITLFRKKYFRVLTLSGLTGMGLFMLLLLFIGVLDTNIKITLSTVPFFLAAFFVIRQNWNKKTSS